MHVALFVLLVFSLPATGAQDAVPDDDEACANNKLAQQPSEAEMDYTTTTTALLRGAATATATTAEEEKDASTESQSTRQHEVNPAIATSADTLDLSSSCHDLLSNCAALVAGKESTCIDHFTYMQQHCAATCGFCSKADPTLAQLFDVNARYEIHRSFHAVPQVMTGIEAMNTWLTFRKTEDYMYQHVHVEEQFATVRHECQNRHELCTFWAACT